MQIRQLRYLVVLAREGHFGRAATALSISQSALSQALQQVERHFGTSIVDRGQSGFHGFTEQGEAILQWARQSLVDHDRLLKPELGRGGELSGSLRIGIAPVVMSIVALLTTPYSERHPDVSLTVLAKNVPEIERSLRAFDIDAGVTYLDGVTKPGLRRYVLYEESYYLLVPSDHALRGRDSIDWLEVGDWPLCMLTPDLHMRVVLQRSFATVGKEPKAVIETDCSLGLFAHVRSGKWLTIVPQTYFYLLGDLAYFRAIPILNPLVLSTIGLVIQEKTPLSPLLQSFIDSVEGSDIAGQLARYRWRGDADTRPS
ncbi:LysR family transcriptional regulator [Beijerinckia sp. L45]|uniref:LysR family transcriptional regulator n=1 Tax=Beijerinckia sp. L45 TaxID=1641855 RepID=UPI00131E70CE|nr:LysR family transcriptional regulator [Beijerinckia sp. L45]